MNREIKFRIWHKVNEQMLYEGWNNDFFLTKSILFDYGEDVEIMQYAGLKDKNGNECYEKDYDANGNMIDWCERCCGYQFFQIDIPTKDIIFCHNCEGNFMLQDHIGEFEIIGNIHSNPSLLTTHP